MKRLSIYNIKYNCIFCKRVNKIIYKYNLKICRQCFREKATDLGFKKY